ncbi:hypothetical protein Taro_035194 [Colocasia esculenta]|uniref:Uncharacterized protein n=1 Tax=Colocasia esculenta TaxID=4460 RepID=A0A843VZS2_COLES|nr:hypothetical protein [Colocasia esculenta]
MAMGLSIGQGLIGAPDEGVDEDLKSTLLLIKRRWMADIARKAKSDAASYAHAARRNPLPTLSKSPFNRVGRLRSESADSESGRPLATRLWGGNTDPPTGQSGLVYQADSGRLRPTQAESGPTQGRDRLGPTQPPDPTLPSLTCSNTLKEQKMNRGTSYDLFGLTLVAALSPAIFAILLSAYKARGGKKKVKSIRNKRNSNRYAGIVANLLLGNL